MVRAMDLEVLPNEILSYIFSFATSYDRNQLQKAVQNNSILSHCLKHSTDFDESSTSSNGTRYSLQSFLQNGSISMPYIKTLDLTGNLAEPDDELFATFLLDGIRALQLERWPRRELNLYLNLYSLQFLLANGIWNEFLERTWNRVYYNETMPVHKVMNITQKPLHCKDLHTTVFMYVKNEFHIERKIVLTDSMIGTPSRMFFQNDYDEYYEAFEKLCTERHLQEATIHGILSDKIMARLYENGNKNETLQVLQLHNQSVCTWTYAHALQRVFPNIHTFQISYSNLLASDFDRFHWSLWPHLKSLDISKNYTLQHCRGIPCTLQKLKLDSTNIESPLDIPPSTNFTFLAFEVDFCPAWLGFLARQVQLCELHLYVEPPFFRFADWSFFWLLLSELKYLRKIVIFGMYGYYPKGERKKFLQIARTICPNIYIECNDFCHLDLK